jgi:hypothetical protein
MMRVPLAGASGDNQLPLGVRLGTTGFVQELGGDAS